ncbi:MAG: hypothetical protein EBR82_45215 [Caulobacteraceae bacterium]|nr:hypothetical protein [Caulobacteraceae bacterium]
MSTNDGGPAFPQPLAVDPHDSKVPFKAPAEPGMTLRDWFIGQAIIAIYQNDRRDFSFAEDAGAAVKLADAMIAELNKPNT